MSTLRALQSFVRRCPSCYTVVRDGGRLMSTTTASRPESESIFSDRASAWDFFNGMENITNQAHAIRSTNSPAHQPPRQAMTARESNAFNEMFEMIFSAVDAHERSANAAPAYDPSVGVGRGAVDDLIGRLRKYPRNLKATRPLNEALDRQLEAMESCTTDQELLTWATTEVFGESQRFEKEARNAMSNSTSNGSMTELPVLQPPNYPVLLARLIKIFREKYGDPHLALAMFNHARRLSIASYVFGCTTQVYNEVIQTYWDSFKDLESIRKSLEEMKTNAVKVDAHTRKIVESIRRGVAEQNLWAEESEYGSGEVWDQLAKIEEYTFVASKRPSLNPLAKQKPNWDFWKTSPLQDAEGDEWGFNQWGGNEQPQRVGGKEQPQRVGGNERPQRVAGDEQPQQARIRRGRFGLRA